MAITRLKRKVRKNKTRAAQKKAVLKRLLATPVVKRMDEASLKSTKDTSLTPSHDNLGTARITPE